MKVAEFLCNSSRIIQREIVDRHCRVLSLVLYFLAVGVLLYTFSCFSPKSYIFDISTGMQYEA